MYATDSQPSPEYTVDDWKLALSEYVKHLANEEGKPIFGDSGERHEWPWTRADYRTYLLDDVKSLPERRPDLLWAKPPAGLSATEIEEEVCAIIDRYLPAERKDAAYEAGRAESGQAENGKRTAGPLPLPGALPPVPAFDEKLLPEVPRPWIVDVSERAQALLDFAATGAIVALSSALGRRHGIRPKRHDDWLVVSNLYGMVVAPPGFLKSPLLHEVLKPLARLEAEGREQFKAKMEEYALTQAALQAEKQKLMAKFRGAKSSMSREDLVARLRELQSELPTQQRFLINDATVEKLGELLNENPNGLLLFRDELSGWLALLERSGHENDRAFYLEAWNGYSGYTYDRIARGTTYIEHACLSILGGITPGTLSAYLRETFTGAKDDGLIQRFQVAVYPDPPAGWKNVDCWPDTAAKNRAFEIFRRFISFGSDFSAGTDISFSQFDPAAQEFFDAWRAELETKLRNSDEHPVMRGHLSKYRKLMPALALILHLCDADASTPVGREATMQAAAWCDYLEAHARRIYYAVTARIDTAARLLGEKIRAHKLPDSFTSRDVYRCQWTGLTEPGDVQDALDVLEDLNWLSAETVQSGAAGGRPTLRYTANPKVWL